MLRPHLGHVGDVQLLSEDRGQVNECKSMGNRQCSILSLFVILIARERPAKVESLFNHILEDMR